MLGKDRRAVVIVAHIAVYDPWVELRRQGGDYIREHIVRQPTHPVVVGLARPHPVTRRVGTWRTATPGLSRIIPHRKQRASRADRKVRLPLGTGSCVGVQLERRAERLPTVGRANVKDVAGIGARAVLGIDVANDVVEGGRLTPAHVPPVSTEHGGEVAVTAAKARARSREGGAGIGVGPGVTAVG